MLQQKMSHFLDNYPNFRKILRKYWFLNPLAIRILIIYYLNYLTSIRTHTTVLSWAVMTSPRTIFQKYNLEGEKIILDLVSGLQIQGIGVDIGACFGKYTILMAKTAKKVISLEPDKFNYKFVQKNVKLNNLKNVQPLNLALDVKEGKSRLRLSSSFAAHRLTPGGIGYDVKCISLESLLNRIDEPFIDLIKMDIEGAEFRILPSANKEIFRRVKAWIIEIHSTRDKKKYEIDNLFKNNGYETTWLKDPKNLAPVLYLFAKKSKS